VADLRRHHERHAAARLEQAGHRHQERRPRAGQAREADAARRAEAKRLLPYLAAERLIADEWRIAGGAVEALFGGARPGEEVTLVHQRPRRPCHGGARRLLVLLDSNTVAMADEEAPVATGGVEQPLVGAAYGPLQQAANDGVRGVVGASSLTSRGDVRRELGLGLPSDLARDWGRQL
jgi:hypothetical protein